MMVRIPSQVNSKTGEDKVSKVTAFHPSRQLLKAASGAVVRPFLQFLFY